MAADLSDVWTSNDSGVTWNDVTPAGPPHSLSWRAVATNANGTNLVAADESADLWTYSTGLTASYGATVTMLYEGNGVFIPLNPEGVWQ